MSVVSGIRRSSRTSTWTHHPSLERASCVTEPGSLWIRSASSTAACRATSPARARGRGAALGAEALRRRGVAFEDASFLEAAGAFFDAVVLRVLGGVTMFLPGHG